MKLSELNTIDATKALSKITPCIANITSDQELLTELKKTIDLSQIENKAQYLITEINKITAIIPILLEKRRNDIFGIIAAINNKSIDDLEQQNILITMREIKDLIQDKELIDFFKSCMDTGAGE